MGDTQRTDGGGPIVEPMSSGVQVTPRMIIAGVALILAVIFIAQNTDDQTLEFLWFEVTMPLWVFMLTMLVAGALIGQGIVYARARNKRKKAAAAAKAKGKG